MNPDGVPIQPIRRGIRGRLSAQGKGFAANSYRPREGTSTTLIGKRDDLTATQTTTPSQEPIRSPQLRDQFEPAAPETPASTSLLDPPAPDRGGLFRFSSFVSTVRP